MALALFAAVLVVPILFVVVSCHGADSASPPSSPLFGEALSQMREFALQPLFTIGTAANDDDADVVFEASADDYAVLNADEPSPVAAAVYADPPCEAVQNAGG